MHFSFVLASQISASENTYFFSFTFWYHRPSFLWLFWRKKIPQLWHIQLEKILMWHLTHVKHQHTAILLHRCMQRKHDRSWAAPGMMMTEGPWMACSALLCLVTHWWPLQADCSNCTAFFCCIYRLFLLSGNNHAI